MVDLVQTAFWEGDLAEESTWQAVVLIPKGKGDYRGIGLVEVGQSRMRAEDLKGWLAAARRGEKEREAAAKDGGGESRKDDKARVENWARVVELVQTAFRDGDLAEESTWQAVVLIPKGKGDYRGISLVEVCGRSWR